MSRFDYVAYDEIAQAKQAKVKEAAKAMEAAIMPLPLEMEEPELVEPSTEQLMIAEQEAKLIEAQNRIAELEQQVASLQRVNDLEKNLEELTRMVEKLRNKEE